MGNNTTSVEFFLAEADVSDDAKFRGPFHTGNKIEPLVDGSAFFPAVEEAMAAATESIYATFWNIYPDTPLLSAKVKSSLGVKDWQGLLTRMAGKNVRVRIISSDFDPIVGNDDHQRGWNGYRTFVAAAKKAKLTNNEFQVFCSLHPASMTGGIVDPVVKSSLKDLIATFNKTGLKGLEDSPGVWRFLQLKGGKVSMASKPSFETWPASYHQKTLVIDGSIGFVGGINISDFYQNTPEHLDNHRAHDVFCRVEGPVVADIERNFVGRWNAEFPAFNTFVANANGLKFGSYKLDNSLAITPLTLSKTKLARPGNATAQLHRTVSTAISGYPPVVTLTTVRDDIARTYEKVISLASDYVYIENQYVRSGDVADFLIKRFKANKQLQVILVVPVVPEELEEGKGDRITKEGLFLEFQALTKLQAALGRNVGIYSLVQNSKMPKGAKKGLASFGSMRIYPHSKVLIVDDVFASIGSANVNPRSFQLDSEVDLGWHDPASVQAFREQLWKEHLGSPTSSLFAGWKAKEYVKEWDAIANKNSTFLPEKRQGFIVPHDPKVAKGEQQLIIPEWLAGLGAGGQQVA
jgi:phosphatidylserine/phosphatidylglycerophosphate/cardiolipin synthase-like enzyme